LSALQTALDEAGVAVELKLETVTEEHSFLGIEWTTSEQHVSSGPVDLTGFDNSTAKLVGAALETDTRIILNVGADVAGTKDYGGAFTDTSVGGNERPNDLGISINTGILADTFVAGTAASGPLAGIPLGLPVTLGTAVVHELGHAYGWFADGANRVPRATDSSALKYENQHRKLLAKPPVPAQVRTRH
jgi:hypothetical protein